MAKPDRPTLPFTLHGQRRLIAGVLLVAAFLLALLIYLQWGHIRALAGDCDAIVLTLAAARWDADNTNLVLRDDFRDAGPIQQVPLFLTLSPKNPSAPAILEEFEQGMARLRADGTLDRLHALYFPSDATARKAP